MMGYKETNVKKRTSLGSSSHYHRKTNGAWTRVTMKEQSGTTDSRDTQETTEPGDDGGTRRALGGTPR